MLRLSGMLFCLLASPVLAKPAEPVASSRITAMSFGVFCITQPMDRKPAPGTEDGWVSVPNHAISFHWPDQNRVPAARNVAFGVTAYAAAETQLRGGEVRVYRPDQQEPDVWVSNYNDASPTTSFHYFGPNDDLTLGLWAIEAWHSGTQLYRVEFEVVAPELFPDIAEACSQGA